MHCERTCAYKHTSQSRWFVQPGLQADSCVIAIGSVGLPEGAKVGDSEGASVGAIVGDSEGTPVGGADGVEVGNSDGVSE